MNRAPGLVETPDPRPEAPQSLPSRAALAVVRLRSRLATMRRTVVLVATAAVLMLGVLIGLAVDPQDDSAATAGTAAASTPSPTASTAPTVADVYEQAVSSVVVVTTDKSKLGSGVVANADGDVLTAAHVVAGATTIKLTFADGTTTTATVASTDATTDIATLTPAALPETLVPATIGGDAQVGDTVIAIGNPLGLTASVSTGIVSGLDRDTTTADGDFSGLIQFDASVNAGSSGGPLLDSEGNVIGIVVSMADPGKDDAFAGIGFAVPIGSALGGGDGDQLGSGDQGPQV